MTATMCACGASPSAEYELAMAQAARRRDWPQLHPEDAR
jgi:hypothetical protein